MVKKISIIGRGTVGCLAALKFSNLGYDIDWYHDPNTPPLSVGEGTDLALPNFLKEELNLNYDLAKELDIHYKQGVEKIGWSKTPFTHWFGFGSMAMHFNASKLQNYIINKICNKVNIIEKKISPQNLNSYTINCSGTSTQEKEHNQTPIPVNTALIAQCSWDKPKFDKTLCIAKSYGWVFLIPLKNRCSVGYLYNKDYCNPTDVSYELSDVLVEYNLTSQEYNKLNFNNFYRKENFYQNISYTGNASFFLEPLEATSLNTSIGHLGQIHRLLKGESTIKNENERYINFLEETIDIIMLHYLIDPPINNSFWEMANLRAYKWFNKRYNEYPKINLITTNSDLYYSTWEGKSFQQNLTGLNLYEKLNQIKNG